MRITSSPPPNGAVTHLQARFLALLPQVCRVAGHSFRRVRCAHARADRLAEAVALCWVWFIRLVRRGRQPELFAATLARFAARAVHAGRRVCGQERARDVLSAGCQRRGFSVTRLPAAGAPADGVLVLALADNTRSPVPDQVQFRIDFSAWLGRLPVPRRRLVERLALGHRTTDLAPEFGLSAGRISQLRREFADSYATFCDGTAGR